MFWIVYFTRSITCLLYFLFGDVHFCCGNIYTRSLELFTMFEEENRNVRGKILLVLIWTLWAMNMCILQAPNIYDKCVINNLIFRKLKTYTTLKRHSGNERAFMEGKIHRRDVRGWQSRWRGMKEAKNVTLGEAEELAMDRVFRMNAMKATFCRGHAICW